MSAEHWYYDRDRKQWNYLQGDGRVLLSGDNRTWIAFYDGRRIGEFISELNALDAVEQRDKQSFLGERIY